MMYMPIETDKMAHALMQDFIQVKLCDHAVVFPGGN